MSERTLTNGDHAIYQGSHEEYREKRVRILGLHPAYCDDGTTRHHIVVLKENSDPLMTLSNVRRGSLR